MTEDLRDHSRELRMDGVPCHGEHHSYLVLVTKTQVEGQTVMGIQLPRDQDLLPAREDWAC